MEEFIIKPAEQRVIILPEEQKETTLLSGIIIPGTVDQDKPGGGLIIATGKGSKDNPMEFSVGQRVVYSQYSGLNVKLNLQHHGDHTYKVMNQMDIMAVVQEVKS